MLAKNHPTLSVPLAQSGPITNQLLEQAAEAAENALKNDNLTNESAALLLMIAGPALKELVQRRCAMDVISDVSNLENVLFLPTQAD